MAQFTYTAVGLYLDDGRGSLGLASSNNNPAQLLDDNTVDTSFTVGEGIEDNGAGSDLGTFAGTFTDGSGTYVVINAAGTYYLFSDAVAAGSFPASFTLGALDTSPLTTCFLAGSLIATPDGEAAVETLTSGDVVLTQDGRTVAIEWVGQQTLSRLFTPAEQLNPVCLAVGSLGHGVPHRDLYVTPDHAMYLDGVLCTASALVNGTTITRVAADQLPERFAVYHIALAQQDIVLANGAPTESFADNGGARRFDTATGTAPIHELVLPRATTQRQLPASVRSKLGLAHAA